MIHSKVKIPSEDANSCERMTPMYGTDYTLKILTLLFLERNDCVLSMNLHFLCIITGLD